jgi:hypothetical protein
MEKYFFLENFSINSDREKKSASNYSIFNESYARINGFLGQTLIFPCIKSVQDVPYYPTNIKKKRDTRDQHILFYRSMKITNEM